MSTILLPRRNPGMGYLRLETADLRRPAADSPPQGGLLTPSSACDRRRSSITSSNWSFVSQVSATPSQSSSIASFQSSQEPSTPPQYEELMNFAFVGSETPYDGFAQESESSQQKVEYLESHLVLQSSPVPGDESLNLHSKADWVDVRQQYSHQQRLQFDGMIPASVGIHSSVTSDSNHGLDESPWTRTWIQQQPTSTLSPEQRCGNDSYQTPLHQDMNALYDFPPATCMILPSSNYINGTTIAPTEMLMEDTSPISDHHFEDFHCQEGGLLTPSSECDFSPRFYSTEVKHEQSMSDSEDEWRSPSSRTMIVQRSGAKGLKREERAIDDGDGPRKVKKSVSKRRNRSTTTTYSTHPNANLVITVQKVKSSKKFTCGFRLPTGSFCTRPFDRSEHLKRHRETHEGQRRFRCPVPPEMKCGKLFGRRDNWSAHLRTHLSEADAGRNERMRFGEMFAVLREKEESEEAEKSIRSLLGWKAKGGHLKPAPTTTRRQF
jgi:hypothetical protein